MNRGLIATGVPIGGRPQSGGQTKRTGGVVTREEITASTAPTRITGMSHSSNTIRCEGRPTAGACPPLTE